MMKKDFSKKLGILGVSFALMASPLAFADMHEDDEPKTGTKQEADLDEGQDTAGSSGSDSGEPVAGEEENDSTTGTQEESDLDASQESTGSSDSDDPVVGEEENDASTGTQQESEVDEDE
ncbi:MULTISPECIES: hypothetical protein [unclassified Halomonas]|uniref:hypothetical protein n=1 Tax=unclassified Halomonas TaxID=2609666 RepID=UPI0006D997C8|nr:MULTISPECIES: hypothetical protein [unclassified Halomonas]KPQ26854.1 MAG: hypothetical protein HLUCCO06_16165 [Halomonas sp. HL-93]SBR46062.1 hypothetical protein GA0071314_0534 [Halomonas sp. HL-93]SNY98579.1 hypothetical protein SAMN04488142_3201 [Halomonas sp. hl-4]